jgi:hypothetical protein
MQPNNETLLFVVVVFIASYAYSAYLLSKTPDPSTEYGFSLNALMAGLVAFGAALVSFMLVMIFGAFGYLIAATTVSTAVYKIIKKMMNGDKTTTT